MHFKIPVPQTDHADDFSIKINENEINVLNLHFIFPVSFIKTKRDRWEPC